jgi:hypothetical protein
MPRQFKSRLITNLVRTANGKSPRGTFNHAVSMTAEGVNNKGLRRQIQFLLNHLGPAQTAKLMEDLMLLEQEINNLTAQAVRGDRLSILLRLVYDLKMKEAHQIAHAKPRTVVRYLVRLLGEDKVNRLINGS